MGFSVQERPVTLTDQAAQMVGTAALDAIPPLGIPLHAADAITRFGRQHPQAAQAFTQGLTASPFSSMFGMIPGGNILQAIFSMLQQLMSEQNASQNPFGFNDNEQYFQNASGASVGDPHLSFNGKTWDNMGSQPDLLHSDSFEGGYQLSTQTTPPAPNGVTYNQSATVATNYGQTNVTMDKDGNATITQNGNSFPMQPGQSYDLDNGEFVQRNQDGSLQITCNNGNGGTITTTMRSNGTGVDVNTTANNVDLGGALVNGNNGGNTLEPMQPRMPWHHHPTTYTDYGGGLDFD